MSCFPQDEHPAGSHVSLLQLYQTQGSNSIGTVVFQHRSDGFFDNGQRDGNGPLQESEDAAFIHGDDILVFWQGDGVVAPQGQLNILQLPAVGGVGGDDGSILGNLDGAGELVRLSPFLAVNT